jgi:lysozyme
MGDVTTTTDPLIHGLDVSSWQNPDTVDWFSLYRVGYRWAYVRASDGKDYDSAFLEHVRRARDAGFLVGAYSYLHAPRIAQWDDAMRFVERVAPLKLELLSVADLESCRGASAPETAGRALAWCDVVEDALDQEVVVYTYPSWWQSALKEHGLYPGFASRKLWIADYRGDIVQAGGLPSPARAPEIPKPWRRAVAHQWRVLDKLDRNVTTASGLAELRRAA